MGAPGQRPLMLLAASLWCFVAALPTARAFDRAPTWKSVARVLSSSPSPSPPFDERFETWFFEWHQGYSQEEVAEIACNMLRCLNDMFDLDSFIAAMNASHSLRTDSSTASTGAIWPINTINGERVLGADLPVVISIGDAASGTNSNTPRSSAKLLDVDRVDNAPATNENSATLLSSIRNSLSSLFSNSADRKTEVGGESTMSTPLSPSPPPPSAARTTSTPEPLSQRTTLLLLTPPTSTPPSSTTSSTPPLLTRTSPELPTPSLKAQLPSSSQSPPLSSPLLLSPSSPMLAILSPQSLSQPLTPSSPPSSSETLQLSSQPPLPAVLLLSTAPPPPLAPPPPPSSSSLPPLPPKLPTPSSPAPPLSSSSSIASKSSPSPILASSSALFLAAAPSLSSSSPLPPLQFPPPPPSSPTSPSSSPSPTPNRSSVSSSSSSSPTSSVHDGQSDPNETFPTARSDVVTVNQHRKATNGHIELLQTTGIATSPRIEFKVLHPRGRPWSPVNAEVLVALSGMALLVMGGVAVASVLKRRRTHGQYKLVAGVAKVETRA